MMELVYAVPLSAPITGVTVTIKMHVEGYFFDSPVPLTIMGVKLWPADFQDGGIRYLCL